MDINRSEHQLRQKDDLKIGVIGGAGWLGAAIAAALIEAEVVTPDRLTLSYRSTRSDAVPGAFWTTDNQELADRSDILLLCVRPADWAGLHVDASGKLVLSVMAGIGLAALAQRHGTARVVRTLPNAAVTVRKSYTPWLAAPAVGEADRAIIRRIFDACGTQDEVRSEAEIDYLTGLTGSGPAFPALLAEAMMLDAIDRGFDRDVARRAVNAVLIGTGRLLERQDDCPSDTVRTFLDYRGTTAAAIEAMTSSGLRAAVANGLAAAHEKSVRLGEPS
ncbi:pyrroline-5-carboxylate reductase [Rhizobium rhizosphaerae]|uniref:Pyrroline-5-carboxylate reductase n=1 Tax=Xaviernesmea rhizosphaerae TaxID=1672749 RepID=A0A1Q9ADM2_9HYPH|nr:pyrroline-5-carboxylate reductase dimerization domain-containing protein [Xaviernesmea rhizosphaerae]OLP53023.1 pyrroline-5-carboxylate reductase [Xaviernesmea rhizosphaerae]